MTKKYDDFPVPTGPVRDLDGRIVPQIRVHLGEMTCTNCGDTVAPSDEYCLRCSAEEGKKYTAAMAAANRARLVPTISYLNNDEYVVTN